MVEDTPLHGQMNEIWHHRRIATAVLVVTGIVLGAVSATTVLLVNGAPHVDRWNVGLLAGAAYLGTIIGAPLGAVVAPPVGWLLLRHVPVHRSVVGTTLGSIFGSLGGGAVGRQFNPMFDGSATIGFLGGAVLGVIIVSVILGRRYAPSPSEAI
jgi:hypothetical protein